MRLRKTQEDQKSSNCWEIIQCNYKDFCPARFAREKPCWEIMEENNSFQCQYGLCRDCIVYVSKSNDSILSESELSAVMQHRKKEND